jgi:hypothetical protein
VLAGGGRGPVRYLGKESTFSPLGCFDKVGLLASNNLPAAAYEMGLVGLRIVGGQRHFGVGKKQSGTERRIRKGSKLWVAVSL